MAETKAALKVVSSAVPLVGASAVQMDLKMVEKRAELKAAQKVELWAQTRVDLRAGLMVEMKVD